MINLSWQEMVDLSIRLAAWVSLIQSVETLTSAHTWRKDGVWSWDLVQEDFRIFPNALQKMFHWVLSDRSFYGLLVLRIVASVVGLFIPLGYLPHFFLVTLLLMCMRFRGTMNGGSDYISVVQLIGLSLVPLSSGLGKAGVWYIAVQAILSYFVGGVVKIRQKNWLTGEALAGFLRTEIYSTPQWLLPLTRIRPLMMGASIFMLVFEVTVPILFFVPDVAPIYLSIGVCFHLLNWLAFGLNRFVWAWIATYPAILYCI